MTTTNRTSHPIALRDATVTDPFWASRRELVRTQVIPYQWNALNDNVPGAVAQDEQGLGEVDAVDMPMTTLAIPAWREVEDSAQTSALYHDWRPAERKTTTATLIPYFAWANRGENEMTVFLRG